MVLHLYTHTLLVGCMQAVCQQDYAAYNAGADHIALAQCVVRALYSSKVP
jgi:hypothetical protein